MLSPESSASSSSASAAAAAAVRFLLTLALVRWRFATGVGAVAERLCFPGALVVAFFLVAAGKSFLVADGKSFLVERFLFFGVALEVLEARLVRALLLLALKYE